MSFAMGRYFEDFHEGEEIRTLGRTVTEADIVNFSGFSGDFNPLHTDAEYAATQPFKARIAHGMCGFSMAVGLLVRTNVFEGTILAFFGIENWRFKEPVMIGDTIHAIAKVAEKKETSKLDRGLMIFDFNVINQKGISVMSGGLRCMMLRKPKHPSLG
jgi:acyl dehydratase